MSTLVEYTNPLPADYAEQLTQINTDLIHLEANFIVKTLAGYQVSIGGYSSTAFTFENDFSTLISNGYTPISVSLETDQADLIFFGHRIVNGTIRASVYNSHSATQTAVCGGYVLFAKNSIIS